MTRPPSSKRGYNARWRRLREIVLNTEPMCRYCNEIGHTTPAQHVDHIIPVRERPDLLYVIDNLQPLCSLHHNSTKAREESIGYTVGCDVNGHPQHWK